MKLNAVWYILVVSLSEIAAQVPAFPGALGFGAQATGGRGGTVLSSPWSPLASSVTVYSSKTAFRLAASLSGALPFDQTDSLIVNQVKTLGKGTTGLIAGTAGPGSDLYTSQAQTGLGNNGYGTIRGSNKDADSDNDGMPDYWEKTVGTNPGVNDAMTLASDGNLYLCG
jgi:Bacterial TSP3 repeat